MRRSGLRTSLAACVIAVGSIAVSPAASANGWITIFPNYSDRNCPSGVVQHVKVAGFPGNTRVNANNQRWARLEVGSGNVTLVAQLFCKGRNGGAWATVTHNVNRPQPWKSYYF
jgi:hypothetical protein